jgi:hypothetical protein
MPKCPKSQAFLSIIFQEFCCLKTTTYKARKAPFPGLLSLDLNISNLNKSRIDVATLSILSVKTESVAIVGSDCFHNLTGISAPCHSLRTQSKTTPVVTEVLSDVRTSNNIVPSLGPATDKTSYLIFVLISLAHKCRLLYLNVTTPLLIYCLSTNYSLTSQYIDIMLPNRINVKPFYPLFSGNFVV